MFADTFAFFGLIVLILTCYGVFARMKSFCLLGFFLVLIMGLFVFSDDLYFKTGETKIISTTQTVSENTTTIVGNETTTFNYAPAQQVSVFSWKDLFGMFLILVGLGGTYIYAIEIRGQT